MGEARIKSPYAARIHAMWNSMRDPIIKIFPKATGIPKAKKKYFKELEAIFVHDAYNSLSIEGYQVSEELIARIESGKWDPNNNTEDQDQRNAMAAKGYREAFKAVQESIRKIFSGESAAAVAKNDTQIWYRELFSQLVVAKFLKPEHLVGYRDDRVIIRGALHSPPPKEAVIDSMEAFFECLANETEASVRAVLGHFIFVYIHPYMDGNGRTARFLMNAMLASGGYPWTVVLVKERNKYFSALESASVKQDIQPFAKFILSQMKK